MTEMAVVSSPPTDDSLDRASTSSTRSLDLPSLQPLSHDHPLLSSSSFDADAFLLSRVHIPLEELRGELRAYLGQLREELVQLINDDYEEFISLGTGLRGEGERLRRLVKPLKGLGEEVEVVREVLADHQQEIQGRLDGRAVLREERVRSSLGDGANRRHCSTCWRGYLRRSTVRRRCSATRRRRMEPSSSPGSQGNTHSSSISSIKLERSGAPSSTPSQR